jgi:hypothetical protein
MNKIQPTYVSFEQAKLLKEKRFDLECKMCVEEGDNRALPFDCGRVMHKNSIHPYYSAPEQWQIVEWLRVNHGIWVKVDHFMTTENTIDWDFEVDRVDTDVDERGNYVPLYSFSTERSFTSPQEAYSAAFDYILKELI